MDDKEKAIKTLKDFGKLPTSRIAAIIGSNNEKAKSILEELVKEKKIKKIKETLATYWRVIK